VALPNAAGNDDAAAMVADMLLVNKGAMQDVVFHMLEVTGLPRYSSYLDIVVARLYLASYSAS
jgi:hypothetical protein